MYIFLYINSISDPAFHFIFSLSQRTSSELMALENRPVYFFHMTNFRMPHLKAPLCMQKII